MKLKTKKLKLISIFHYIHTILSVFFIIANNFFNFTANIDKKVFLLSKYSGVKHVYLYQ